MASPKSETVPTIRPVAVLIFLRLIPSATQTLRPLGLTTIPLGLPTPTMELTRLGGVVVVSI